MMAMKIVLIIINDGNYSSINNNKSIDLVKILALFVAMVITHDQLS